MNDSGDLGVVLYAMGGDRFVQARGFIRTDPRNWSGISTTLLDASDSAYIPDPDEDASWGHFGSVREYGNCDETFLGSVYTVERGVNTGRFVWFGAESDGCVDLAMTSVSRPGKDQVQSGNAIDVSTTTQNQGSADAPASTIGYYLSRDTDLDDDDIRFEETRRIDALDIAERLEHDASLTLPSVLLPGEFHLIACADDPDDIDEITVTNNCAATPDVFTVNSGRGGTQRPVDYGVGFQLQPQSMPKPLAPGATIQVREDVVIRQGTFPGGNFPRVQYSLTPAAARDDDEINLTAVALRSAAGRRGRAIRQLRVPRRTPSGRYRLVGCLRHPRGRADFRGANDCRVLPRRITVRARHNTRGPKRRRAFRDD